MSRQGQKVLSITLEPVSSQMAGPAIRCLELSRRLAPEFDVTVFSPHPSQLPEDCCGADGPRLVTGAGKGRLYELAGAADIVFIQANVLKPFPALRRMGKHLIVDLYDPYLLSVLAQYADDKVAGSSSYRLMHQVLERHMAAADFSICASERQRDYWLGRFCALGRLTPEMYRIDPSFRKLIDVVPFGLPTAAAERTGRGMRGLVPGIAPEDKVMIWGGGIWEWFDPLTVIEATARVSADHPELKLFFMGWKSPNPQVDVMPMALRARHRAEELGVLGRNVIFGEGWVPYEERVNYLLDADIAVSAHFDLPETRFSFRTRMLDYFWAGLPILTTGGDQLAEMIERSGAGLALPYEDASAWEAALRRMLADPDIVQSFRAGSRRLSEDFTWERAAVKLVEYCRNPYHLPAFSPVTMPSLVERLHAVYARGGKELVLKRSRDILGDILKRS